MKLKGLVIMFFSLALIHGRPAYGQFLPQEVAGREEIERFLLTAEILRTEPIGEGVTKPTKVYLGKDGVERNAVWKNPSGMQLGFLEGWRYEIAAYRMDKLIGLNMIPPAVEREFRDEKGALSLWATSQYSLLKIMDDKIEFPEKVRKLGGIIDVPVAYRAIKPDYHGKRLKRFLKEGRITVATFTSAATFSNFREIMGEDADELLQNVAIAVIGPVTAKAIEKTGLKVHIMPKEATVEAMVEEIQKWVLQKQ